LANLIRSFDDYNVLFEATTGKDFLEKMDPNCPPDIVLMDINMPEMDGYDTALWLKHNHPNVKVLALSMYDNEHSIIRMLKCGAKGYILKDIDPGEFRVALDSLVKKGFYYSELMTGKLIHAINATCDLQQNPTNLPSLNKREIEFLKLACNELSYKEIADKMFLSARTVEGYRDDLFEKLHVKSRVGLVMFAVKNGIVNVDDTDKLK
jgi:DNA-binding NarL/FixJ family response regulator